MSDVALSQMAQLRATMDSVARQTAAFNTPSTRSLPLSPVNTPPSFAAMLDGALRSVSAVENQANQLALAYEQGQPQVSLNEVMVNLQKANLSLQTTVQMRNRLVAAYQEIASMSI